MTVDSFKFLPRIIATFYKMTDREPDLPIPWTPLPLPVDKAKFGLVTSAGIYLRETQEPFNLEREKSEPHWGDPSFRIIPATVALEDIAVSHLHFNTSDVEMDINILLPIHRMLELVERSLIGALADEHYSFMGYQGFPPDASAWQVDYGPQVARAFLKESVHCVLLTPA